MAGQRQGFDFEAAVERLDWRFSTGAQGTVPEPTTAQVGAFFDQLRTIFDRPEDERPKDTVSYLAMLQEGQIGTADEKLIAAYADLCSNQPSAEQIAALPHRERQMFFGWISGQVVNPTSPTRDT